MGLRAELGLTDTESLHQDRALDLLPECDVSALKHIKGLRFEDYLCFGRQGYHVGAFAVRAPDGRHKIVFNDHYSPLWVRVHLMEEFFHIRLGHPLDVLRLYPADGHHRTHSREKEDEAYGCSIAALVPFAGLEAMLARGEHIAKIAEYYVVPVPVVEERITVTGLGDLASARMVQLPLASMAIVRIP